MIVIGDAAHAPAPSSGQGASLALEDGVLLAMSLRDASSIEAGFAAFEAIRRERVEKIVAYGARSSSSKTPGRSGHPVRDVFMRVAFRYFVTEEKLAWMYDHRIAGASGGRETVRARWLPERLTDRGPSAMLRQPRTGSCVQGASGPAGRESDAANTTPGLGR